MRARSGPHHQGTRAHRQKAQSSDHPQPQQMTPQEQREQSLQTKEMWRKAIMNPRPPPENSTNGITPKIKGTETMVTK